MDGVQHKAPSSRRNRPPAYKREGLLNFRTLPVIPTVENGPIAVPPNAPVFPIPPAASTVPYGFADANSAFAANEILLQLNNEDYRSDNVTASSEDEERGFLDDPKPPELDETDAKRQVQLIFRTPTCWRSDTDQSHLLYLLKRYPALASQYYDWDYNLFWEHGNEWSTPLCFMLTSGANLEAIQTVYELYPEAISQPQGVHRDLPLHFACRYSAPDEVIAFIASVYPLAVTVPNSSGMLPLHCVLGKKHVFPYGKFQQASLDTVKFLLEMYPESLLVEEKEKFYSPLQIAFNHGYSFEVIDYMMSRIPRGLREFQLIGGCYHKMFSVNLDLAESELVSKLLPRIERFRCEPTQWTVDGLVQLLKYLQHNTTIVKFDALNIPVDVLMDVSALRALKYLVENNSTIEGLGLHVQEGDSDGSLVIQMLNQSLVMNRTLQLIEIGGFCVSAKYLAAFLTGGLKPKVIGLHKLVIEDEKEVDDEGYMECTSRVENLIILDCRLQSREASNRRSALLSVLDSIARLPRLIDFTLRSSHLKGLDITPPLVQLLTRNESIESLSVSGPDVNMELFCGALQRNTTLRCFDAQGILDTREKRKFLAQALENHNAVLEYARMPTSPEMSNDDEYRNIQYYTRLNQYGRAIVQNPNTTKGTFIKLLQTFSTLSRVCRSQDKLAVQYGLLRESPSLWCTASGMQSKKTECHYDRKRKWGD